MNVYYLIAGTGEKREYLQRLIDGQGMSDRIKLLGFRSDIKDIYAAADIFVFPSLREGLSVALMEAMASGLHCVVSKIRGNTDLIKDDNALFDPYSEDSITATVKRAIRNDFEVLGKQNLVTIKTFSTFIVNTKMFDIYKRNSENRFDSEEHIVSKHAFLIMAHNEYTLLSKLISLLDDERADIYLHIDKKSERPQGIATSKSMLTYVPSIECNWGGYSQIQCELNLLEAATLHGYEYYHLLSGVDLPIVSNDEFYLFFKEGNGKNYLRAEYAGNQTDIKRRIQYYRWLQDKPLNPFLKKILGKGLCALQMPFVNRTEKLPFSLYFGDNWFSITHDLATYVISRKDDIRKYFNYGICADELFLQSIAMDSDYAETICNKSMRYVDWCDEGHHPKVLTMDDYNAIMKSGALFARKFSESEDPYIIERIYEKYTAE